MKNKICKVLSLMLAVLMLFTSQTFAATSSRFGSNNYCYVTISRNLLNAKKYKTASVKITTYSMAGWKTSGKINVTLTDGNGNYIGTYKKSSGDTIKLGNDHSSYRIYISEYNKSSSSIWGQGSNWINDGKCWTWKVSNNKNCSIR